MIIMAQVELVVIMVSRLRVASLRPTLAHKRRKARITAVELGLRRLHQSLVLVLVMHVLVLSKRRPRVQRLVADSLLLFGFNLVHGDRLVVPVRTTRIDHQVVAFSALASRALTHLSLSRTMLARGVRCVLEYVEKASMGCLHNKDETLVAALAPLNSFEVLVCHVGELCVAGVAFKVLLLLFELRDHLVEAALRLRLLLQLSHHLSVFAFLLFVEMTQNVFLILGVARGLWEGLEWPLLVSSVGADPTDVVLAVFLDEIDALQHVGDVVDASLLNSQLVYRAVQVQRLVRSLL